MNKLTLTDKQREYLTQILNYLVKHHPNENELHVVYSPEGVFIHTEETYYQYFDTHGNLVDVERKRYEIPLVKYTIETILREGTYYNTSREFLNGLKPLYGVIRESYNKSDLQKSVEFDFDPFKLVTPIYYPTTATNSIPMLIIPSLMA